VGGEERTKREIERASSLTRLSITASQLEGYRSLSLLSLLLMFLVKGECFCFFDGASMKRIVITGISTGREASQRRDVDRH